MINKTLFVDFVCVCVYNIRIGKTPLRGVSVQVVFYSVPVLIYEVIPGSVSRANTRYQYNVT